MTLAPRCGDRSCADGRVGRALALVVLTLAASACLGDQDGAPAINAASSPPPPSAGSQSTITPGPTSDDDSRLVRVEPGTPLDVVIRKNYGAARWTGPWDVDLISLTLHNGREWVLVRLAFSRFHLVRSGIRGGRSIGDSLSVFLDGNGDQQYEREIHVNWGYRGGLLTEVDDQVSRCRFDPSSDAKRRTVTFRIPRDCFPHLMRMRARAAVWSIRHAGSTSWSGQDLSRWSPFADVGRTVTVSDAAR